MKRSEINELIVAADRCFTGHGWALPPKARWDVTDFGLGAWRQFGLVLVNLAEEPEYCEKLMYARKGMTTPSHTHHRKKEDIICRWGKLAIQVWNGNPPDGKRFMVLVNHEPREVVSGDVIVLEAGWRVTLVPGIYHAFYPITEECIIGEVSTANDDVNDNIFVNPEIGRYPGIEEDEVATVRLVSEGGL
jgi:D-lyxose ketol-isomerase